MTTVLFYVITETDGKVGGNWTHMTDWLPYAALETAAFPVEPPPYKD